MGAVRGARDAGATQPEKGAHLVWGYFFDFLFIVTLAIWIVGLSVAGRLSQGGAAFALFALVLLVGAARAAKIGIVRLVFRIAVPVASVVRRCVPAAEACLALASTGPAHPARGGRRWLVASPPPSTARSGRTGSPAPRSRDRSTAPATRGAGGGKAGRAPVAERSSQVPCAPSPTSGRN